MSFYTRIILFLWLSVSSPAMLSAADTNLSQGFCDIAWGTRADALTDLKEIAKTTDVIYYTRTENPFEIYGADLGRVVYAFFKGRLFSVYINIAGKEKFRKTLEGLKEEYGPPRAQYRVGMDVYIWESNKIKIKLKHFDGDTVHKLAFYYIPISKELNEQQIQSAEEIIFNLP